MSITQYGSPYTASQLAFTPTSNVTSNDIQSAVEETASNVVGLEQDLASTSPGKGSAMVGFKNVGSGSVVRTAYDKLTEVQSVEDFGAVGDGVTDNSTAFQSALNWLFGADDRCLDIPYGTYSILSSLSINNTAQRRNVKIEGHGATLALGSTAGITIQSSGTGLLRNMSLRDIRTTGGYNAITLKAASNVCYIYNCVLDNVQTDSFKGSGITLYGNIFESTMLHCGGASTSGASVCIFTGSATGNILTVTAVTSGSLAAGMTLTSPAEATIISQVLPLIGGESLGGIGRYNITSSSVTTSATVLASDIAFGLYLTCGTGGGVISSLDIFGGTWRGGIYCIYAPSPTNDFRMTGGTVLFAQREGMVVEAGVGTRIDGLHTEGNWVSADVVANGGAGIRFAGNGVLGNIVGVSSASQKQQYAVRAYATSGGVFIYGGANFITTGKYGLYQCASTGDMLLQGSTAQNYDLTGSVLPSHVGRLAVPTQLAQREQYFTYAATRTPDLSTGCHVRVAALTGDITINNPTNRATTSPTGYSANNILMITLQQDSVGGRAVTWGSDFATGMSAISSTANTYSTWTFSWINGKWRQTAFSSSN